MEAETVRIITWNVNGLRALLGKGTLARVFAREPDVLCLQEVKARPDQLSEAQRQALRLPFAWNPAQRAGYSGVLSFFREQAGEVRFGLDEPRFDVEGRVIRSHHPDFILFNIYFPSGQSGRERIEFKLEFYSHLLKICEDLHRKGERLILAGDFNTAHRPIDLKRPRENATTSGFLPEERAWVQKFIDAGFIDPYRLLYPDRVQYTWWTYRSGAREKGIGWRIDYFLVSEGLLPRVQDVIIHEQIGGSDHCPVELVLS
jgi:exodeoxyribonuclease-3